MRTETFTRRGETLTPGVNVDVIDVVAGLNMAWSIGYTEPTMTMVIEYGLNRWARGEEAEAQKMMLDYGVSLTSVYMIVAAAKREQAPKHTQEV